jgi:hypothetical protein
MKRCPAIHMPVANATRIVALAHCIVHPRELVTKADQFDIFAVGAACGVTGHHCGRRGDSHQGQSGEYDANRFRSALVCHFAKHPSKALIDETRVYCHLFPTPRVRTASGRRYLLIAVPDVAFHPQRSPGLATAHRRKTHSEMVCEQACYRSRCCRPLPKLFRQNAALVTGTACPENRLLVC